MRDFRNFLLGEKEEKRVMTRNEIKGEKKEDDLGHVRFDAVDCIEQLLLTPMNNGILSQAQVKKKVSKEVSTNDFTNLKLILLSMIIFVHKCVFQLQRPNSIAEKRINKKDIHGIYIHAYIDPDPYEESKRSSKAMNNA